MQTTIRAALEAAAKALRIAAEDIESWGGYAPPYFQKKYLLNGCIKTVNKAADAAEDALAQPQQAAPVAVPGAVWGMYGEEGVALIQRGTEDERIVRAGGERLYRLAASPQAAPAPAVQGEPLGWLHESGQFQPSTPYMAPEAKASFKAPKWRPLYTHPAPQTQAATTPATKRTPPGTVLVEAYRECGAHLDDAPGTRAGCAERLKKGAPCERCPSRCAPAPPQGAPAPQQALTQAQRIRLWNNSPEYHGDVVGRDAFERLVKLVESVHRIGKPAPQLVALTNADVGEAWRTTEAARSDYGWTSCEWFQAGVRFAHRFYGITQPSQQEQANV